MPCEPFKSNDGKTTGIICRGRTRPGKCASCDGRSEYECDFPSHKKSGTCDAKVCARCSLHIAGRWMPLGTEFQTMDSYDFCPTHKPFVFVTGKRLIYVVNSSQLKEGELIDRTTPLGNPYKLTGDDTPAQREQVIRKFKAYLWQQMQKPESEVSRDLARLREIWLEKNILTLRCWCTPRACHGQVIAKALAWQLTQERS